MSLNKFTASRALSGILTLALAFSPFLLFSTVKATPRANKVAVKSKPTNRENIRREVLAYLEKQAQIPISLPDFPQEKTLVWVDQRHATATTENTARYKILGEHLLVSTQLLSSEDLRTRKRGYWIVSECANFTAAKLKTDKWLLARLYEGFLLPYVTLANTELWRDPSRARILENGVSAFGNAGERDKQIRVLEWILSVGARKPETNPKKGAEEPFTLGLNTLDWARGTLANLISTSQDAQKSDLERAIELLKAIQSPDMKGFQHLQITLQKRLDALPQNNDAPVL